MLSLNETIDHLVGKQCLLVWSCVEDGGWSCLVKRNYGLRLKVMGRKGGQNEMEVAS